MTVEHWWIWPLALFAACFVIGLVAVPAGIGGGTLFVPLVGTLFPFHLDFVRGAGLLVALASALAAGPYLLRSGLGSLRLALPLALAGSIASLGGAALGMLMPAQLMQLLLGILVLGIAALMMSSVNSEHPLTERPDPLGRALGLEGMWMDRGLQRVMPWRAYRTRQGMLAFAVIGGIGGMFGIGAGWANVPALHLLMGVPLTIAAGTSSLVLSLVNSSAAWVYLDHGALLPAIAVPSVLGTMLGARIGARVLPMLRGPLLRYLVLTLLILAGGRALLRGMGWWL